MMLLADDAAPEGPPPLVYAAVQLGLQRAAEVILFPEPFAETNLRILGTRYENAFTQAPLFDPHRRAFEWDGDHWQTNTIGHGLMGAELYIHARRCHWGAPAAFAFTAVSSTAWEYLIEANGVRPSAWDLTYTPLAGLVFGEARYQVLRAASHIASPVWRRTLQVTMDPMGELGMLLGSPC